MGLLKPAKRDLGADILALVNRRRRAVENAADYEALFKRGYAVWLGLTIELTFHIIIELLDQLVTSSGRDESASASSHDTSHRRLEDSHANETGSHSYYMDDYSSSYYADGAHTTTPAADAATVTQILGIRFGFELGFAAVFTLLVILVTYVSAFAEIHFSFPSR